MPMDLQALMHKTFARERCGAMSFGLSPQYSGNVRAVNKPGVPFLGHRQTVQTQIRRRRTQRLIRVFTIC